MAWEMLLALPEDQRQRLLEGGKAAHKQARRDGEFKGEGGRERRLESKVGKKIANNKIERNLSWEYKESSRFDTYQGDEAQTADMARLEDGHVVDESVTTSEDTDRQGLMARAIDPALWQAEDPTRLQATVRLVVQADEAPILKPLVAAHWDRHQDWLEPLHFSEDGTWREVISDDTASSWVQRTWWGAVAVFQAVKAVIQMGKVRSHSTIDLETVSKGFVGLMGVRLDEVDNDARPKTDVEKLAMVVGGMGTAEWLLGLVDATPAQLLEVLGTGAAAGSWLVSALEMAGDIEEGVDIVKELQGKTTWQPEGGDAAHEGNTLVIDQNDVTGHTVLSVPMLALGAVARVDGTTTTKLGGSLVAGATITIKGRTATDVGRHVEIEIARVQLNQLLVAQPELMLTINNIDFSGLRLKFTAPEERPATMLEHVGHWVQMVSMQVLQAAPLEQLPFMAGTLGEGVVDLAVGIGQGLGAKNNATEILGGDWSQLEISFDNFSMNGLATSGGDFVDHLEVGKTDLSIDTSMSGAVLTGAVTSEEIGLHLVALGEDLAKVDEKLAKPNLTDARRLELEDQKAWYEAELGRMRRMRGIVAEIEAKKELVDTKTKRLDVLAALDEPDADQRQEQRDLSAEISQLGLEIKLLQSSGVSIEGELGAIDIAGVQTGGTRVGAAHLGTTTFDATSSEGGEAQGFTAHTDGIEVTDIEIASAHRRDVMTEQQIRQLEAEIAQEDGPPTKAQAHRLDALKRELAFLQPFVKDYEDLRARMRELNAEDRARFLELRAMLTSPPSTTVGSAKVTGVDFGTTMSGVEGATGGDLTGLGSAGIHADQITVSDVTLHETSQFTHGGDVHIGQMSATDVSLGADATGDDLLVRIKAEHLGVTGQNGGPAVTVQGLGSAAEEDMQAIGELGIRLEAEIAELESRDPLSASDRARLETLRAQHAECMIAIDDVERDVIAGKDALRQFIDEVPDQMSQLVGVEGVDWSRGASLASCQDRVRAAEERKHALRHGDPSLKTPVAEQECIDTVSARVVSYVEGIERLQAEIAALEMDKADLDPDELFDQRQAKLIDKAIEDRRSAIAQATGLEITWRSKLGHIELAIAAAEDERQEALRLLEVYRGIVAAAEAAGLAGPRYYRTLDKVEKASAFHMLSTAKAAVAGYEDMTIDEIEVTGVDVAVEGAADVLTPMLDGDPQTEGLGGDVTLSAGTQDGPMVRSLKVSGVAQGDNALGGISLSNVTGSVTLSPDGTVQICGLALDDLVMSQVHWDLGDYGLHAPDNLSLQGVLVDAELTSTTTPKKDREDQEVYTTTLSGGTVQRLSIDEATAPAISFRYYDYLISAGDAEAEGEEAMGLSLLGVEMTNLDLTTYAFEGLDIDSVDATQLNVDLAGGLKTGAQTIHAGDMTIKSVVTKAAREADAAKDHDADDYEGLYANRFDIGVGDLDAHHMAVEMQTLGLKVDVAELKNGQIGNVFMDLHTGEFGLKGVAIERLALGPIRYNDGDMYFQAHSGMTLQGAILSVSGRMPTEAEVEEARDAGRAPVSFEVLQIDRLYADQADFVGITYCAGGASTMAVDVGRGHLEKLNLLDYDVYAESLTMKLSMENADFEGLEVKMEDALSTTTLEGGMSVGALTFAAGWDDDKNVPFTTVGFAGMGTDKLNYESGATGFDGDQMPTDTHAMATLGVDNAGGTLDMRGRVTTFSDLSVGSVQLPTMMWSSETMAVGAENATLTTITAAGWLETVEEERAGMLLPRTDMHISSLYVDKIEAGAVQFLMGDTVDVTGGGRLMPGDPEHLATPNLVIDQVRVTELHQVDGVMEEGLIELGELDGGVRAKYDSAGIKAQALGQAETLLHLFGNLNAKTLSARFDGGTATIDVQSLDITNVNVTKYLEGGERIEAEVPHAQITGLSGEVLQAYSEEGGQINAGEFYEFVIPTLEFLEQGKLRYFRNVPDVNMDVEDERSADQKVEAARERKKLGEKLAAVDWDTLLDSFDGNIWFDLFVEDLWAGLGVFEYNDVRCGIRDGHLDYEALEDSLGFTLTNEVIDFEWKDAGDGQKVFVVEFDGRRVSTLIAGPIVGSFVQKDLLTTEAIAKSEADRLEDAGEVPLALLMGGIIEDYFVKKPNTTLMADEMAPTGSPLRDAHDDKAEAATRDRLAQIEHLEQLIPELERLIEGYEERGERVPWFIPIMLSSAYQELANAKHPEWANDNEDNYANVWLQDVRAELTLGDVGTQTQVGLNERTTLGYETIKLLMAPEPRGKGYQAQVSLLNLAVAAELGGGDLDINVGDAQITSFLEAFTDDKILVWGGLGKDPIKNPVRADVYKGAAMHDVLVRFNFLASRASPTSD